MFEFSLRDDDFAESNFSLRDHQMNWNQSFREVYPKFYVEHFFYPNIKKF